MTDFENAIVVTCKDCGNRFCPVDGACGCRPRVKKKIRYFSMDDDDVMSLISTIEELFNPHDIIIDSLDEQHIENLTRHRAMLLKTEAIEVEI